MTDGYQASQANALELLRPNLAEPSTKTELRQTSPIVANSLALAGEISAQSVPGAGALSAVDSKEKTNSATCAVTVRADRLLASLTQAAQDQPEQQSS